MKYYRSDVLSHDYYIVRGSYMLNLFLGHGVTIRFNYGNSYNRSDLIEIKQSEFEGAWNLNLDKIKHEKVRNGFKQIYNDFIT